MEVKKKERFFNLILKLALACLTLKAGSKLWEAEVGLLWGGGGGGGGVSLRPFGPAVIYVSYLREIFVLKGVNRKKITEEWQETTPDVCLKVFH